MCGFPVCLLKLTVIFPFCTNLRTFRCVSGQGFLTAAARAAGDAAPPPRPEAATVSPALVHGEPLVLEWFGPAATAITVPRVGCHRLDTGEQDDFLRIDRRACVSWQIRIKSPAADLEPLPQDSNRPGVLGLGHQGRPQFDPLAKKPRAVLNMSRAPRSRLCSLRHHGHSS